VEHSPFRRALVLLAASLPFADPSQVWGGKAGPAPERLAALETASNGRLGVAAIDTAGGARILYRAQERFPLCSTFKVVAVSAVLKRASAQHGLLHQRVAYAKEDLVAYSPITSAHAGTGLTVGELCAAALEYSDNTAANLLLRLLGGPAAVTAYARSLGDGDLRLDRWETELNTAIPGDDRDTTTPAAMAATLRALTLGEALEAGQRDRLVAWMRGNTTGAARIRAGVPEGWTVADKTGTGEHGATNDVGVVWPPSRPPIVLAIYFTQREQDARAQNEVVAAATRIVIQSFG
jgi:beta-lactamase class A